MIASWKKTIVERIDHSIDYKYYILSIMYFFPHMFIRILEETSPIDLNLQCYDPDLPFTVLSFFFKVARKSNKGKASYAVHHPLNQNYK